MTSYNGATSTNHDGNNNSNYRDNNHYHQQPSNQNPPSTNQYQNNNQNPTHHQYAPPHNNQYVRPHHNTHIYEYPPSTHMNRPQYNNQYVRPHHNPNRAHLVNRPHQYPPSYQYVYPNQLNTSRNTNIVLPHSGSRRKKSRVFCNSFKYQQTGKEMREWIREKHRRHHHNNTIGINNNTNGIMYDNTNGFGNIIGNGIGNINRYIKPKSPIKNKLVSGADYVNNNNNSINGFRELLDDLQNKDNNRHGFRELLDELQNKDNNNNNSINGHNKSLRFTFNNSESYVNNNMPLSALYNPNEQYIRQTVHHMDNAYKNMINNIDNNNINESHESINNCNRNETNTNMLYQSSLILNENDNFRYKKIYKILLTTCPSLPNTICKNIAEFSIGDLLMCMNDKCDNEILICGFSEETDYFIHNPNININNNPLIIDVNKQTVIFCAGCKNSIVPCEFKIEKKNEIYFDKLWCSNWFTWNGIHSTCSPCRQGKIMPINGIQIAIKVENNKAIYSILTENKWS